MAESDKVSTEQVMGEQESLRYLEFVQAAAAHMLVCAAALYAYAKNSAGPLKPGVETVEGTVKTVVGPVYDRFHYVPLHLLKFLDRKVGESVQEIEKHVPIVVKEAPNVARSVAEEVHRTGVVGTAAGLARNAVSRVEPVAKDLYTKYEPVARDLYTKYEPEAEKHAVAAWRALNRLPLVPQVAHVVVPTAANLSQRYNRAVSVGAEKGYRVASYLPLVPTERIARVFADETPAASPVCEMEPISAQ
ncbi:hypothetical protein LUZ63_019094 [Rhynchospora breviuscula]|uniref:Stress-related protein n=1 Tax=Rhynchospora breviuscula TaxID=2022672 RepID=A0A9Q0HIW8_9POAL|nr:hypothetical protein LUZ63_019094 [Rhynchospora breviuscula]